VRRGIPALREPWILARGDTEEVEPREWRWRADETEPLPESARFLGTRRPRRAKPAAS